MKVLVCHNEYQQTGGESAAVRSLTDLLQKRHHQVLQYGRHNDEISDFGLQQKARFLLETIYSPATYRELTSLIRRERPDIAHVHNVFPLLSPSLYVCLADAGVPIVQTIHNFRLMCLNSYFLRQGKICELCAHGNFLHGVRYRCYRDSLPLSGLYAASIGSHRQLGTFDRIGHYIALTEFAANKLVDSGVTERAKISVLGNFLSYPIPDTGMAQVDDPYFVFMGRLSEEKGLFILLAALRNSRIRVRVLGDGPLLQSARDYCRLHNLNVEFCGYISGAKKFSILRHALAAIVPSQCYDNFPVTILECAAVATPLIASDLGGLQSLIVHGSTGYLFPPGDSAQLRNLLDECLSSSDLAITLGENAARWVRNNFTEDIHYCALMKIYNHVLQV